MKFIKKFFGDRQPDAQLCPDNRIHFGEYNGKVFGTFYSFLRFTTTFAMLAIILYYVYAFAALYNGSCKFDWLLGIFSDFVEVMNFSIKDSPYIVQGSSYPPLAIIVLYPFALICKDVFERFAFIHMTPDELTANVIAYPQFWIAIILFFVVCSLLVILLCAKLFGIKRQDITKLGLIVLFSAPFIYAVMRGNTIYFALIFLLIFLIYKDSKNPFAREISYLFLALAGVIKIYPLFFGVFLLKDKKIFASARVALYFGIISWLSFYIFEGGLGDLSPFFDNLGGFMSDDLRLLKGNNISISAQLYKLLYLFVPRFSSESLIFSVTNLVLLAIVFLSSTYAAITAKSNLSRYAICFAIVTLIPSVSYFYTIIFAVLPFLEYIRVYDTLSRAKRIFYFVSFIFLFTAIFVFTKIFVIHSLIIMAILGVEITTVIRSQISSYREKKRLAA